MGHAKLVAGLNQDGEFNALRVCKGNREQGQRRKGKSARLKPHFFSELQRLLNCDQSTVQSILEHSRADGLIVSE